MNRAMLVRAIMDAARRNDSLIATAESCTGGMIAAALTDMAGSSAVFERGFVTYSNAAKIEMLGVRTTTLERFGAVSSETAIEMATGALARSGADIAVSVTGIAGPAGGTPQKPVGLVWFGIAARAGSPLSVERHFSGPGREAIRAQATEAALIFLLQALGSGGP